MRDEVYWSSMLAAAAQRDVLDPLAGARPLFEIPRGMIYLDGNSLGPMPHASALEVERAVRHEWAQGLISSWNDADWFALPTLYGDMLAPIIGADEGEVVVCDTTSINIYKTLHAALALRPGRRVVVAEGGSFPTDLYVIEGVMASRPDVSTRLEGRDGVNLHDLIDADVAVVLVNQVDYRSGRKRDLVAVTEKAHAAGALVIWDLCHSAGVMEVGLNAGEADMAVGCTYKYLNGGPGAPSFVFAARRHLDGIRQPLSGWWGHAAPFRFDQDYAPDPGIRKFLCGTQGILSFRALKPALEMLGGYDLRDIRAKSVALTELFIRLVDETCSEYGVSLMSPRAAEERGSQVAFQHPEAYASVQALIARGVVGDFRMPDVMRFGFAPLYIGHVDVVRAARMLEQVLAGELWRKPEYQVRGAVT